MFCSSCGNELKTGAKFCDACGNKVSIESKEEIITNQTDVIVHRDAFTQSIESDERLLQRFVGKNAAYYLKRWTSSPNPIRKSGWNWAAFFLTVFWLGYRKMYKFASIYLALWIGLGILFSVVKSGGLSSILGLVFAVILGRSGNSLYYAFAMKNIENYKNNQMQKPLEKQGGTSWGSAWTIIAVNAIYGILIFVISTSATQHPLSDVGGSSETTIDSAPANARVAQREQSQVPQWNTKDLDATKNGNIPTAVKVLQSTGDIKSKATVPAPADVAKAPWNYYGKPIKISGTLAIVQEYPPGSDISKVMGGTASEAVIASDDGTITDTILTSTTGNAKVGDAVTVYGYAVGTVDAPNKMGGTTTELAVVGNLIEIN